MYDESFPWGMIMADKNYSPSSNVENLEFAMMAPGFQIICHAILIIRHDITGQLVMKIQSGMCYAVLVLLL